MSIFDSGFTVMLILGGVMLAVAVIVCFRNSKIAAEKRKKTKLGLVRIAGSGMKFNDSDGKAGAVSDTSDTDDIGDFIIKTDTPAVPPERDDDDDKADESVDDKPADKPIDADVPADEPTGVDTSADESTEVDTPIDADTPVDADTPADEPVDEPAVSDDKSTSTPIPNLPPKRRIPETVKMKDRKVLAVEDVEVNREFIAMCFEGSGVKLEFAEDGAQACDLFENNPEAYSLVLMDIQMPVMDGYEAARRMRSVDTDWAKQIPIIALTANAFKEDMEQCFDAGMDDHVTKPINMEELQNKVFEYISMGAE